MLLSTLLLALAIGYGHAQLVHICPPNWPVVAYVLGSENNATTTFLLACPAGVVQTTGWQYRCDFVQPITFIQGPSTINYNYTGLGGIGSATISQACDVTSPTYQACTFTGGVRTNSGVSTNVVQLLPTPGTITWMGSQAVALYSYVDVVQDTASLLTYTPAGATVTGLTTVTMDISSSTSLGTSSSLITAPPTGSLSATGASRGIAGQEKVDLGRLVSFLAAIFVTLDTI